MFKDYFIAELRVRTAGFALQIISVIFMMLMYKSYPSLYTAVMHSLRNPLIVAIAIASTCFGLVEICIANPPIVFVKLPFRDKPISLDVLGGILLLMSALSTVLTNSVLIAMFSLNLWLIGLSAVDAVNMMACERIERDEA